MTACSVCGNEGGNAFEVIMSEKSYHFDCFECAIHRLAPACAHCGCKIIGHAVGDALQIYCCMHCGKQADILLKKKDL